MRSFTLPAAAAALLLLSGCGGAASDQDQVREVAGQFTSSFANGDMKRACELMTSNAKQQIVSSGALLGGGDCAKIMGVARGLLDESDLDKLKTAKITEIKVTGQTATAQSTADLDDEDDGPMRFTKRGGHWLVEADDDDEQTSAQQDAAEEPAADATEEATPTPAPMITAATGEPLALDGYEVTVTHSEHARELPGDEYTSPVKADGKFLILTLTVRNTSKQKQTFSASNVQLVDADGTVYSSDTGGGEDQIMALPDYLDMREIQPKTTETGKVAFDLPAEADVTSAQFASSLALFGDEYTGSVTLR